MPESKPQSAEFRLGNIPRRGSQNSEARRGKAGAATHAGTAATPKGARKEFGVKIRGKPRHPDAGIGAGLPDNGFEGKVRRHRQLASKLKRLTLAIYSLRGLLPKSRFGDFDVAALLRSAEFIRNINDPLRLRVGETLEMVPIAFLDALGKLVRLWLAAPPADDLRIKRRLAVLRIPPISPRVPVFAEILTRQVH